MFIKLSRLTVAVCIVLTFLLTACSEGAPAAWTPDNTVSARLTATSGALATAKASTATSTTATITTASVTVVTTPNPNGLEYLNFYATIGDSKTVGAGDDANSDPTQVGYQPILTKLLVKATNANWQEIPRYAIGGKTTGQIKDGIDTWLNQQTSTPKFVLINLGINDGPATLTTITPSYTYILDAVHTKWPLTKVYGAMVWGANRDKTLLNNINGAISTAISSRPDFAHPGIDEIFLDGGDGGKTLLVDGTHPNHAGYERTAQEWAKLLGY